MIQMHSTDTADLDCLIRKAQCHDNTSIVCKNNPVGMYSCRAAFLRCVNSAAIYVVAGKAFSGLALHVLCRAVYGYYLILMIPYYILPPSCICLAFGPFPSMQVSCRVTACCVTSHVASHVLGYFVVYKQAAWICCAGL